MTSSFFGSSHEIRKMAEVLEPSVTNRMAAMAQSPQLAKAMVSTSSQLSQMADAAELSSIERLTVLTQSTQLAEIMGPTSSQLNQIVNAAELSSIERLTVLTQSTHLAETMGPASSQLSQMATDLDSVFTDFSHPVSEDSHKEIASFQIQSLTEFVYDTLTNNGISVTPLDLILIETMILLFISMHFQNQNLTIIVGAAMEFVRQRHSQSD